MIGLITLVLCGRSLAADPAASLEAIFQARHDLLGEPYLANWDYLRLDKTLGGAQGVGLDAYAGLDGSAGLDNANPDLFLLDLHGNMPGGTWTAGRQQAIFALRPQLFDGANLSWRVGHGFSVSALGGVARQEDLNDLRDGVGTGRLSAAWQNQALAVHLGAEMADGEGTPLIARQDLELHAIDASLWTHPELDAMMVVSEPSGTVERARVAAAVRIASPVRLSAHVAQTDAADPSSLFGDAILDAFARGPVQEAGGDVRISSARWAVLSGSWTLLHYGTGDLESWGQAGEFSYAPPRTDRIIRILPGFSTRSGPGGVYYAAFAETELTPDDVTDARIRLSFVPFRKGHMPWAQAAAVSLDVERQIDPWIHLGVLAQATTDPDRRLDVRGGGLLKVMWP